MNPCHSPTNTKHSFEGLCLLKQEKLHRKQTNHLHEDVQPHINTILKEHIFSLALQDTSRETDAI